MLAWAIMFFLNYKMQWAGTTWYFFTLISKAVSWSSFPSRVQVQSVGTIDHWITLPATPDCLGNAPKSSCLNHSPLQEWQDCLTGIMDIMKKSTDQSHSSSDFINTNPKWCPRSSLGSQQAMSWHLPLSWYSSQAWLRPSTGKASWRERLSTWKGQRKGSLSACKSQCGDTWVILQNVKEYLIPK